MLEGSICDPIKYIYSNHCHVRLSVCPSVLINASISETIGGCHEILNVGFLSTRCFKLSITKAVFKQLIDIYFEILFFSIFRTQYPEHFSFWMHYPFIGKVFDHVCTLQISFRSMDT